MVGQFDDFDPKEFVRQQREEQEPGTLGKKLAEDMIQSGKEQKAFEEVGLEDFTERLVEKEDEIRALSSSVKKPSVTTKKVFGMFADKPQRKFQKGTRALVGDVGATSGKVLKRTLLTQPSGMLSPKFVGKQRIGKVAQGFESQFNINPQQAGVLFSQPLLQQPHIPKSPFFPSSALVHNERAPSLKNKKNLFFWW